MKDNCFIKNKTFFKSGNTYNTITRREFQHYTHYVWGNAVQLLELKKYKERNIKIVEDARKA